MQMEIQIKFCLSKQGPLDAKDDTVNILSVHEPTLALSAPCVRF